MPGSRTRVVVAGLGAGNDAAAVITERAATLFRPGVILFVGVAGALRDDIDLGDVVVGTRIYAYQSGKAVDGGFAARPRSWQAPHRLEQHARFISRTGRWHGLLPERSHTPAVHFAPIAAGDVVVADAKSSQLTLLRTCYADAAAIEMEGAGLAHAAHLHDGLPALVVRGISDRADNLKHTCDAAGGQHVAAANAAAFALTLATVQPT